MTSGSSSLDRCCTTVATAALGDGRNTQRGRRKGQQTQVPAWRAVRTTRWLYVDYKGGQRELYDLKRDPAQMNSLASDPRYPVRLRTLRGSSATSPAPAARCQEWAAASVR